MSTFFSSDYSLKLNRGYNCKICGKLYKKLLHLSEHMNSVHLKNSPYRCEHCGKQFSYKGSWVRHKKTVCQNFQLQLTCASGYQ